MSNYLDGDDFKAYIGDAVLTAADNAAVSARTWTEVPEVNRLTRNGNRNTTDFQTREGTFTTVGPAKRSFTLSVGYKPNNAFITSLEDAFDNKTAVAFAVMDGDIATQNNKGTVGNFFVTSINNPQDPGATATYEVTVEPASFVHTYTVPAA
ncbi:MAG: phage tail tube protein [Planctomycetota bacterium]